MDPSKGLFSFYREGMDVLLLPAPPPLCVLVKISKCSKTVWFHLRENTLTSKLLGDANSIVESQLAEIQINQEPSAMVGREK